MKSFRVRMFMRKSFWFGVGIAITIVAFDVHLASLLPVRIDVSTASAQELPSFTSTSTLAAAPESSWTIPLASVNGPQIPDTNNRQTMSASIISVKPVQPLQRKPRNTSPIAETPVRLTIPSISLDTMIDPMGLNGVGELDVPPGTSSHVGWWKGGQKPGQMGSAVLDAHVFAAFQNLNSVPVGADIIVETVSGQRLRFVVQESTVFRLSQLTPAMLFGRNGDRWLNLITCAGNSVGDTYSHRLIVYSKFVEVL